MGSTNSWIEHCAVKSRISKDQTYTWLLMKKRLPQNFNMLHQMTFNGMHLSWCRAIGWNTCCTFWKHCSHCLNRRQRQIADNMQTPFWNQFHWMKILVLQFKFLVSPGPQQRLNSFVPNRRQAIVLNNDELMDQIFVIRPWCVNRHVIMSFFFSQTGTWTATQL